MKVAIVSVTKREQREMCQELLEADPWLGHLDASTAHVWAALDESGNVIATAGLEWDEESRHGELVFCVVSPQARGKGLQQRLIRSRVAWARKHGAQSLETYASTDNLPSLISLMKCGFRPKEGQTLDGFLTVEYPNLS